MKQTGAELILIERQRQIDAEGWTPGHDDGHLNGELAIAAARYAIHHTRQRVAKRAVARGWRWASSWWKPRDPIRNLVRAGALIAAEIDRIKRLVGEKAGDK